MSSRLPWHKHRFTGGQVTKKSCIVCSGKKDAPQHQLEEPTGAFQFEGEGGTDFAGTAKPAPPVEDMTCMRCHKEQGRKLPENGAILCPTCVEILKP